MIKYNLVNSMIGNVYPFFLSNKINTDHSYYLYQVVSPKLSSDLIPYISLSKISERTKTNSSNEHYGSGIDIISACLGIGNKNKTKERAVSYLKSVLWKENPIIDLPEDYGFPLIEMESGNNIQKSIVIGLRDSLRWKNYRFQEGNFIDILWGTDTFMVFKIKEDKEKQEIWLEPIGLYNNMDPNMKNPLPVDLGSIEYPKERWSVSDKSKISELNRVLKKLDWESFSRKENKKEKVVR